MLSLSTWPVNGYDDPLLPIHQGMASIGVPRLVEAASAMQVNCIAIVANMVASGSMIAASSSFCHMDPTSTSQPLTQIQMPEIESCTSSQLMSSNSLNEVPDLTPAWAQETHDQQRQQKT